MILKCGTLDGLVCGDSLLEGRVDGYDIDMVLTPRMKEVYAWAISLRMEEWYFNNGNTLLFPFSIKIVYILSNPYAKLTGCQMNTISMQKPPPSKDHFRSSRVSDFPLEVYPAQSVGTLGALDNSYGWSSLWYLWFSNALSEFCLIWLISDRIYPSLRLSSRLIWWKQSLCLCNGLRYGDLVLDTFWCIILSCCTTHPFIH